jgi:hypothetical protein
MKWVLIILNYFSVVSVPRQVADQWEPSEDSSGPSIVDYSEKRSLPISVPSYQTLDRFGEKYVVTLSITQVLLQRHFFQSLESRGITKGSRKGKHLYKL